MDLMTVKKDKNTRVFKYLNIKKYIYKLVVQLNYQ
jgi:hypothetical protein